MRGTTVGTRRLLVVLGLASLLLVGGAVVAADGVGEEAEREEFVVLLDGVDLEAVDGDPVDALQQHADGTQAPVIERLEAESGVAVEDTFWIANAILVSVEDGGVDPEAFEGIAGVTNVSEHGTVAANDLADGTVQADDGATTDGLDMLGVPETWDEFDTRGDGVTVAILDTGVDPDHPDIHVDGWQDFALENASASPLDYGRHGTHVAGTVIGGDAGGTHIGVAPEARHLHGAVLTECGSGGCEGEIAQLLEGMEWAVEEDADVLSLSLGTREYTPELIDAVRNANAAGTVVVGSIGNDGVDSSGSPGNVYETVGVGAVDRTGDVARFSGGEEITTALDWGIHAPGDWPETYVVPDVAAPGVNVVSAEPGGGYRTSSGTSMAAPHVSGTIALGQAATERDVPIAELRATMESTAWKPDGHPEEQDRRYGHGIVDAHAFVSQVTNQSTVNGTVTDAVTGEPVTGATVTVDGQATTTDDEGSYELHGVAGDVEQAVVVTAAGYDETVEVATVPADTVTTVDVAVAGDSEVAIALTDGAFGSGVANATVAVGDYPATERGDGEYVVRNLPGGEAYELTVVAAGYEEYDEVVTVASGDVIDREIDLVGNVGIDVAVTDATTGTSLSGAAVTVERADGTAVTGTTDDEGALAVTVPGTGESYEVAVDHDGYDPWTTTVTPAGGESVPIQAELEGDASIAVSVTESTFDDGVGDATVEVVGERGTYSAEETDAGTYLVEGLPSSATYELVVAADGYEGVSESLDVEGPGARERAVELHGDATLEVLVSDEVTDAAIDDATIVLERDSGGMVEIVTDADGPVTLAVPGTGESYSVSAEASGYEPQETTVTVGSGERVPLELPLQGDAELVAIVTDASFRTTLEGVSIEASGDRGTYTGVDALAGVPSVGTYEVRFALDGYEPVTSEVRLDGSGREELELMLAGDARVDVTVTDGDAGIANASVTVERGNGETAEVVTERDGTVSIPVAGTSVTYNVTADAERFEPDTVVVGPVGSGAVESVTIELVAFDTGLPGFGAVAGLLALLGAGGWRWYRGRMTPD